MRSNLILILSFLSLIHCGSQPQNIATDGGATLPATTQSCMYAPGTRLTLIDSANNAVAHACPAAGVTDENQTRTINVTIGGTTDNLTWTEDSGINASMASGTLDWSWSLGEVACASIHVRAVQADTQAIVERYLVIAPSGTLGAYGDIADDACVWNFNTEIQ